MARLVKQALTVMTGLFSRRGRRPRFPAIVAATAVITALIALIFGTSAVAAQDDLDESSVDLEAIRPDVVALVFGDLSRDETVGGVGGLIDTLERLPGVGKVAGEGREGGYVLYVDIDEASVPTVVNNALEEAIAAELEPQEATVVIGGHDRARSAIESSYRRSVLSLMLVGIVTSLYALWRYGRRVGLAAALVSLIAIPLAGAVAARLVGPFDGTLATTSLPGALAALVVALGMTLRWARHLADEAGLDADSSRVDTGADRVADLVRASLPGAVTVLIVLAVAAVVAQMAAGRVTALTTVLIGSAVAMVLAAAIVPFVLVGPDGSGRPGPADPLVAELHRLIATIDGRNLGPPLLAVFVLVLTVLSAFSGGRTIVGTIRASDLSDSIDAAAAQEFLRQDGADPTESVVVLAQEGTDSVALSEWAVELSGDPSVAWVDVGADRYQSGASTTIDDDQSLAGASTEASFGAETLNRLAIVVPAPGAAEAPALVPTVAASLADAAIEARQSPDVDAAWSGASSAGRGALSGLIALALGSGLALRRTTGSRTMGLLVAALGLIELGSVAGLFNLLVAAPSGDEIVVAGAVIAIGMLRFSKAAVDEAVADPTLPWRPVAHALDDLIILVTLAVAGVVLAIGHTLGGGPLTSRFGVALTISSLVVLVAGVIVLRPALLMQRWQYQLLARPLRLFFNSGRGYNEPSGSIPLLPAGSSPATAIGPDLHVAPDAGAAAGVGTGPGTAPGPDPSLVEAVRGLVASEFAAERGAGPHHEDLFVPLTPIGRQAGQRAATLNQAGLVVDGSAPSVVAVEPVYSHFVDKVVVTTDYPAQRLVDRSGRVVGARRGERKQGVLWLVRGPDGRRIVTESIERASVDLPVDSDPAVEEAPARREPVHQPQPH